MREVLIAAAVATLLCLGTVWELKTWNECRNTNSFFYCMRVLGK